METKTFYQKLVDIQQSLVVKKNAKGRFGEFANLPGMLAAIKPLLNEQALYLTMSNEMIEVAGRTYVSVTATISDGKDAQQATAQAWEGDISRGLDSSQVTGSASTYARKYALAGLFAIDDGSKDADAHTGPPPIISYGQPGDEHASEKQRGLIKNLLEDRLGLTPAQMPAHLEEHFGIIPGSTMLKRDATNIINGLMGAK